MEVHTPKGPIHGWRAFLGEVGIIVLGVLIALGAEQVVQALHWRQQTEQTREALNVEIVGSLINAVERRYVAPCQRDRLTHLRDQLLQPDAAWAADPLVVRASPYVVAHAFAGPNRLWTSSAWSNALAAGPLDHMPVKQAAIYAKLYQEIAELKDTQGRERDDVSELSPLSYPQRLSAGDRQHYLAALSRLETAERILDLVSDQFLQNAAEFGLKPEAEQAASRFATQSALRGACVVKPKAENHPT